MYLILSLAFLSLFAANVLIGSVTHQPFVGDIAEMLLLACAVITFVVAVLGQEKSAKAQLTTHRPLEILQITSAQTYTNKALTRTEDKWQKS